MREEHPLVALARATIEQYVRQGEIIDSPGEPTGEMRARAGVFVSLHRQGRLRGCIGTIEPVRATVAQEIIANAISAATRDPRFPPLTTEELADDLMDFIKKITPGSWGEDPGQGHMSFHLGRLVVNAEPALHARVLEVLDNVRK